MMSNQKIYTFFSPAKINLFLSITGKRDDGYHELETLFQLLDVGDDLCFSFDPSKTNQLRPAIKLTFSQQTYENKFAQDITSHAKEDNLIFKAANSLYLYAVEHKLTAKFCDVAIMLDKKMPLGAGLGAGSSNAATTLIALNTIWQLNLPTNTLATLGLKLGADVPIFITNRSAFATGIGEIITPVVLPERWYLLVYPNKSIPTKTLFNSNLLKRDIPRKSLQEWMQTPLFNVFTPVASTLFKEVKEALDWLSGHNEAFMSGTGSTVFSVFDNKNEAVNLQSKVPAGWWSQVAKGVNTNILVR